MDIVKLYCGELRVRADLLWDTLQQVLSVAGVAPGAALEGDLKGFVDERIERQWDYLGDRLQKELMRFQGASHLMESIGDERRRMEESLHARIDLLALQLRAKVTQQGSLPETTTVQNFYGGSFGVVQSGAGATAHVTQSITIGDTEATVRALDQLSGALAGRTEIGGYPNQDVLDAVKELRTEVQKPQPSRFRLTQVASGIALAVQTSADLKPAYELMRAALLGWGVTLPPWR